MNSQGSSPIRISCPQCGGKVKVPTFDVGQRYNCPRCGGAIVVGEPPPGERDAAGGQASASAPVADEEMLQPRRPGAPLDDDEFGITCPVCRTRLHVRPTQIGTTIKCPDCYSPVTVKEPPKRKQPWQAAPGTWDDSDSADGGPTAMELTAQQRLEKARIEQEQEEAAERESSPERFTEALFVFFADPHAIGRLVVLAIWYELAMTLFRSVRDVQASEEAPTFLGEAAGVAALVAMCFFLATFLYAAAACGLALVRDTSEGLRKIEHWPGTDLRAWGRDVFYVVNASVFAALPGMVLGMALSVVGITGAIPYTAAATFGAMFPPMLLSMFERKSALAPFSSEVWNDIGKRPDPWKLSYLITTIVIIAGLFAFVYCMASGFLGGLVLAAVLVASIMIYFRTVGRLFCILAGRD